MRDKIYLLTGIVIFLIFFSIKNGFCFEIIGQVKDSKSLAPLSGTNVSVKGTESGTSSDSNGDFIISGLKAGEYTLSISMMGYESKIINVKVGPGVSQKLNIMLIPTVIQMQSVLVTGDVYRNVIEKPDLESAALKLSTSIVPRTQIEANAAKTIIDAVEYVPGAFVETRGRKVKQFFSVRGQRYPYPDFAIDGIWQKEFFETPYIFSAYDIESIEVVRSSSGLLTGLSGMAGVINIQTREYDRNETNYELEYGSYNTLRGHLSHGAKIKNFSYGAGLGYIKTSGPENKHAAEQISNLFGKVKWRPLNNLLLQSSFIYLNGNRELMTAVPPADPKFWLQHEKFDPLETKMFTFKGLYIKSDKVSTELKFSYADRKPTYESYDTQSQQTTRYTEADHEWNVNLIQAVSPVRNNTLRLGLFYNHWVAPEGKRFYYGKSCDTETFAGVIVDEHQIGRLNIDAGIRWERTYLNEYGAFGIDGSAKGFGKVTPVVDTWQRPVVNGTLGLVYHAGENTFLNFHAAFGKIEPREGTLDQNMNEPLTESRFKMDFGAGKNFGENGLMSVVTFYTNQKDAIALSGKTQTINDRVMELYLNRDQYQIGFEFECRLFSLWKGVQPFVNATYMISKAEKDQEMVRNEEYPSFISNAGIYQKYKSIDLTVLAKYVSEFKSERFVASTAENPATPQPLGKFLTLDVICGWRAFAFHNLRLYIEMRNITDKKYSTVVGYPDFGRRFNFGLQQSW
ncbi:TonB-dependent receptor [candidate division KSB1 bacterium]|nr:TonB-dependent receptor [candidate division KSB1 bacterium]